MTALCARSVSSRPCALILVVVMCVAGLAACRQDAPVDDSRAAATSSAPARPSGPGSSLPRVVVLGDSLTAGLGLLSEQAYPALLQRELDREGYDVEVVNAGVSGDTSAAGLQRLEWSLDGDVRVLVVALGANDGLRGLPVAEMKKNLATIIETARDRHIAVLLAGMEAPPNFGADYTAQFRQAYRDLAVKYRVAFMPFLLDGVAGIPSLNQQDGIHPTVQGAQVIADHMWPVLKPLVDSALQAATPTGAHLPPCRDGQPPAGRAGQRALCRSAT
jgi:acyl-CoA thioesterase I